MFATLCVAHATLRQCGLRYTKAAKLLDSLCVDTAMDVETTWLLRQFGELRDDWHPDMTACHLKRLIATQFLTEESLSSIFTVEQLTELYLSYMKRREHVYVVAVCPTQP